MEFEATLLKADTPDSNGRVYSKEALKKAVEEYIKSHGSSTAVPVHKGVVDFWNDKFDEAIDKEVLNIISKHDETNCSAMKPYLYPVDVEAILDEFKPLTKEETTKIIEKENANN